MSCAFEEHFKGKKFNWKLGLERIKKAVEEFGGKSYPSVVVAGTNGKGSTAHFAAEALKEQGFKVGLFTSPHVYRFNERFKVNLKELPTPSLNAAFERIKPLVEKYSLSYFEASLLLALELFKEAEVDCAVFEVGLGGRLDAVSALNHQVGVLTKVALDHRDVLGETLEEIAEEKVAAFRSCDFAVSAKNEPEVLSVLSSSFKGKLYLYGPHFWADEVSYSLEGTRFYYYGQLPIELSTVGAHYAENAAVAVKAAQLLTENFLGFRFFIPSRFKVTLPGRFEVLRKEPTVVFDGAHNPNALRALFETALNLSVLGDVVYSGFKDKEQLENLKEVASYLERSGGQLFLVPLEGPRALSTDELFSLAEKAGIPQDKLKKLEKIDLKKLRRPAIITGSFYLGGLIERS